MSWSENLVGRNYGQGNQRKGGKRRPNAKDCYHKMILKRFI